MQNAARKIEMTANVAIVIVACVAVTMLVRNYRANSLAQPRTISTGATLPLKNQNWQANQKNLVLAVSTTCHFCTESAPFYRQLVEYCRQQHVRTIAVLPQPVNEAEAYLKGEGVTVDEIRQTPLNEIEVSGTPTLLLVDSGGVVRNVWVGKLPGDKEKEVLKKLTS
ncbi:MAG: hypothetical protein LAP21_11605 [Acidobacteriia bacterium]|nr:hypothetical protein [Terriglobia bacterium]